VAAKIVRQANKIALLGSPTSAAALAAGHEGAPSALRAAGLAERLRSIGYDVVDLGDDPPRLYQPDEESPRARNLTEVLRAIEALKPRVEEAVKSGALPVILTGDGSMALATVAGARRYFRHISLIYMDRDADLHTPATTPSGSIEGMVVSHLTGRGAAELVRFWAEPPLVRDPDLAIFGVAAFAPAEEAALRRAPLRSYSAADIQKKGATAAAEEAVERIHAHNREFILHFGVDVIAGFAATDRSGADGLTRDEVREALGIFVKQKSLAAINIAGYNPAKDPDGSGARLIIDLLEGVFKERLESLKSGELPEDAQLSPADGSARPAVGAAVKADSGPVDTGATPAHTSENRSSGSVVGEAWSSDALEATPDPAEAGDPSREPRG
jgi:arginase